MGNRPLSILVGHETTNLDSIITGRFIFITMRTDEAVRVNDSIADGELHIFVGWLPTKSTRCQTDTLLRCPGAFRDHPVGF
jgi:hypothetical protein